MLSVLKYLVCFVIPLLMWILFEATDHIVRNKFTTKIVPRPVNELYTTLKKTLAHDNSTLLQNSTRHEKVFTILWYAPPSWQPPFRILSDCELKNCLISFDRRDITNSDLVLFHHADMNIEPPTKQGDQIWVFVSLEALPHTNKYYSQQRWRDKFDWTMTYRSDSEGYAPYGKIVLRKQVQEMNYTLLFSKKTKDVAWVVSNCNTISKRMEYVKRMQQVINVDIFGNCGKPCVGNDCIQALSNAYKFYLSFENALCEDYVTEKLFRNYDGGFNFIPVVRGAPNVKQLLPANTFISSNDFKSPEELARFLKVVGSNETKYMFYLQTKNKFVNTLDLMPLGMCSLCEKLNNKFKRNGKLNLIKMLSEKPCFDPTDI